MNNLIHASGSEIEAKKEIELWFGEQDKILETFTST